MNYTQQFGGILINGYNTSFELNHEYKKIIRKEDIGLSSNLSKKQAEIILSLRPPWTDNDISYKTSSLKKRIN